MPTGTPDFNANLATNPTSPSYDPGEETTRLLMGGGSTSRAGRWVFATGFEADIIGLGPMNMGTMNSLSGRADIMTVAPSPNVANQLYVHQGIQFLRLQTGAQAGSMSFVYKSIPLQSGNMGLECFLFLPLSNPINAEIKLECLRWGVGGSYYYYGSLLMVFGSTLSNITLNYIDNGGTKLIENVSRFFGGDTRASWHYIKLVYDPQTNLHIRAIMDNTSYALSTPGAGPFSSSTTGNDRYGVQMKTTDASLKEVWIDNLICTADEPV